MFYMLKITPRIISENCIIWCLVIPFSEFDLLVKLYYMLKITPSVISEAL